MLAASGHPVSPITLRSWVYRGHISRQEGGYDLREILDYITRRDQKEPPMPIDGPTLAHMIAQEAASSPYTDVILPKVPHSPTLKVVQFDPEHSMAGAAVLVELRKGQTTTLILRQIVPSDVRLTPHWKCHDNGIHELSIRDEDGKLYGMAYQAPLPKLDDEEIS